MMAMMMISHIGQTCRIKIITLITTIIAVITLVVLIIILARTG